MKYDKRHTKRSHDHETTLICLHKAVAVLFDLTCKQINPNVMLHSVLLTDNCQNNSS